MIEYLKLNSTNCKNCYKCIRHCPIKSIRFSAGQAHIVPEECILCGECTVICPQNAKEIRSDLERAKVLVSENPRVAVSLAPSFVARYGCGIDEMRRVLGELGFADIEETANGAKLVKDEYDRLCREGSHNVIISTCCHSVNLLVRKHFPEALQALARVVTPMYAHCESIKKRMPDAKTVFIGPCLSKKAEAEDYPGVVDCVLTFDELDRWLNEKGIKISPKADEQKGGKTRLFPTTGGILRTMACDMGDYTYMAVDGADNCISVLRDVSAGKLDHVFIEMSICPGSCIGGPAMGEKRTEMVRNRRAIDKAAGSEDFNVETLSDDEMKRDHSYIGVKAALPGTKAIEEILRKMGKTKPEDELNCGSCGYNTCREKAIAVYQGKADLSMCLPFLKEKAESFSDNILDNTPNGILVVNNALEVQQINRAALELLNLRSPQDVLGEPVIRILDPAPFGEALETDEDIRARRTYLAEYRRTVEQTIVHDRKDGSLLCIMRDITAEEAERERKDTIAHSTIEITDAVVEKQMRVVQEIASLLGETTAETKIALTKLKESLANE